MKNVIRGETDKDSSQYQTRVCWCNKKLRGWEKLHAKTVAWSYDMEGHAKKGAFKDVVNWQTKRQQQYKFSTLSQTLLATLRIQNRLQVEFCAFSEVEHSFPLVGCARNKRQYPRVLQYLKSFRWMLYCEWMYYLLSIYGMW